VPFLCFFFFSFHPLSLFFFFFRGRTPCCWGRSGRGSCPKMVGCFGFGIFSPPSLSFFFSPWRWLPEASERRHRVTVLFPLPFFFPGGPGVEWTEVKTQRGPEVGLFLPSGGGVQPKRGQVVLSGQGVGDCPALSFFSFFFPFFFFSLAGDGDRSWTRIPLPFFLLGVGASCRTMVGRVGDVFPAFSLLLFPFLFFFWLGSGRRAESRYPLPPPLHGWPGGEFGARWHGWTVGLLECSSPGVRV